jgi:hypothetical protein
MDDTPTGEPANAPTTTPADASTAALAGAPATAAAGAPAGTLTRLDAFPVRTTRDWPAVAAAWIGVVGLGLALFPRTSGLVGWPLSLLALNVGASALVLHRQGRAKAKWSAIIAVVLAVGGIAGCVFWSLSLRQVSIRYEIRGNAPYVMVRYTEAYNDEGSVTRITGSDENFPWNYDLISIRRRDPGELVATIPDGTKADKSISCEVYVDAVRVKYAYAKGPGAVADCGGF